MAIFWRRLGWDQTGPDHPGGGVPAKTGTSLLCQIKVFFLMFGDPGDRAGVWVGGLTWEGSPCFLGCVGGGGAERKSAPPWHSQVPSSAWHILPEKQVLPVMVANGRLKSEKTHQSKPVPQ